MSLIAVLGIIGSVASIIGVALPLQTRNQRLLHGIYGAAITVLAGLTIWYWQQTQRVHDVERAASTLVGNRRSYSEVGFAQAALAFLEKNRDLYPDTYDRAKKLCQLHNCLGATYGGNGNSIDNSYNQIDAASGLEGILRGIGTLEGGT
ncbi:hypothetical protein [Salinisphaera sp. LB1]|uniref:hypothetical protein n=1 Tax=Salinisphaera sp. LB1 TaxID=2183911 RepID=UPI0011AB77DF|nr:hypothetical protein [Salinisphaera sp. LB1]